MSLYPTYELSKKHEMNRLFGNIKAQKIETMAWQIIRGNRIKIKAEILDVNISESFMLFKIISHNPVFSSEEDLFFYCEHRKCIFKTKYLKHSETILKTTLPETAKVEQTRIDKRTYYSPKDEKMCRFTLINDVDSMVANPEVFRRQMLDESYGGLSFKVSKYELGAYSVGDHIVIDGRNLKEKSSQQAQIRHISPVATTTSSKSYYKVGVQFQR